MKPTPPDNKSDEKPVEEVQDYLDELLFQATERPEAQVSQWPEQRSDQNLERRQRAGKFKGSPAFASSPLTMVAGTDLTPVTSKAGVEKESPRPFADPAKPLTFKLPATEAKPAPGNRHADPIAVPLPPKAPPKQPDLEPAAEPEHKPLTPQEDSQEQGQEQGQDQSQEQDSQHQTTHWLENGRPSWAQESFECLLFSVGGLTLAVPLVELGTIYTLSEELTPIFGQIDWFMGLLPVKDGNIRTVNTARLVMPERYTDSMKEHFGYVISINGVDWGLAVDEVSQAITLSPDEVRWRGERAKRPWLAGTVVEHMCALLDVSQLAAMFVQQDRTK